MDLVLVDVPDDLVLPVLIPALVLVLILVLIWTLGIPGRVRSWRKKRKGPKVVPDLDPILSMSQVNFAIGLRAAGRIDDPTWDTIEPLIETFLEENPVPRAKDRVEALITWGEGLRTPAVPLVQIRPGRDLVQGKQIPTWEDILKPRG